MYFFALGIIEGIPVSTYSEDKKKKIPGIITSISGDSITRTKFAISINVQFMEPLRGSDLRYYSSGSYSLKEFKKNIKFAV